MIAPQFVNVGGNAERDIQDLFTQSTLPDPQLDESGENVLWGAKLMIWNGVGYDNYCWTGKTGMDFFEDPEWDDKWTGNEGEYIAEDVVLSPGQGAFLWVADGSAGTSVTLCGEVLSNATQSVTIETGSTGYNMIANPFPEEVDIQDISFTGLSDPQLDETGENVLWGAKLMIWNGVGYDNYCWTGKTGMDFFEDPTWDDKWTGNEGEYIAEDVKIGMGKGFFLWMNRDFGTSSASATFTK